MPIIQIIYDHIQSFIISHIYIFIYLDVTDSLHNSLTGRLMVLDITPLFMDQFGRSSRFCHREFNKEAISDGYRRMPEIGEGF